MSEETKGWELWRQRNGHVVVVKILDNDAPDLYRFQSVNCGTEGWFPRGTHLLGETNHPLDLVQFLGIVLGDDQKPNQSRPCQSAEIERLQAELKAQRADTDHRLTTAQSRLITAQNNHNLHVAGLKAEHRGESAGLQTAIRLILEKLNA